MPAEHGGKTRAEVEQELSAIEGELLDLEDDREMILGQGGHHVPGAMRSRLDARYAELEQKRDELRELLAAGQKAE
ncbi:MAG: hypothetical protein LBQ35_08395 [Spirochaetaceae bacterium]|jgi:hypothetical protein|nr:hypothetical protein [Spirochaetaceae bacterium]